MILPGEYQKLKISEEKEFGFYLSDPQNSRDKVLLPKRYITPDMKIGDSIEVFVYLDSEDRPVATTETPRLVMGGIGVCPVKEINRLGAFLDWGLSKDLFLPYKEMECRIRVQDELLVRLYRDKSGRLAASMKKLFPLLRTDSPYKQGDEVTGRIYEFGHDFGTFVAVDDCYSAMLPKHEDMRSHRIGDVIKARVTRIKPDGKLDITTRDSIDRQMDEDADVVMDIIASYGGRLPFTEKSDSGLIFQETGLSKGAFKRAVGRLYKKRLIEINEGVISIVSSGRTGI